MRQATLALSTGERAHAEHPRTDCVRQSRRRGARQHLRSAPRIRAGVATRTTAAAATSAVLRLERSATDRRKQTGTFYTPHQLTRYLVSRTLEPLVRHASPDDILLAYGFSTRPWGAALSSWRRADISRRAYERALTEAGHCLPADVTSSDRAGYRRLVAQRCLYGVDANPAAVQLARLSLWLTTLAADRPSDFSTTTS